MLRLEATATNDRERAVKITDLQVDGFGVWKGLDVNSLSGDMTIFHGYNEAGKTTLMQFVRSMMFGFSPGRLDKYTPPVYGGLAGGGMSIKTGNGEWDIVRHVDPNRHSDPIGDLSVTDEHDGSVHGSAQLASLMADVDESIFNNVFAIGLREIQELGALNSTAASEYLYRLTSGLDRVSLIDVMRDLKNRREKIWSANPKADSRLQTLSDRRQKLLREIDELKQNAKRWSRIASETTDVNHLLNDLKIKLKKTEREARMVEIAIQIAERWQSRTVVRDQISAYAKLPDQRDVSVKKLDEVNEKLAQQKERIEQVRTQRRAIKTEAMALPINRHLWSQKSRIEAISEHAPWIQSLERQTKNILDEVNRVETTLASEVNSLGPQMKLRAKDIREIGGAGFKQLEAVGDRLLDSREELEETKQDLDKRQFDLGQHNQRLTKSRSELGVSESLEETSAYVNRLKRRVELEEKIEKLNRSRSGLEREIDSVVAEQVLPVEKLAIIGGVFILGFILIGFGILSESYGLTGISDSGRSSGVLVLFLGAGALALSMGIKYHWEKIAKEQLDDYRHQIDIVRQQLKRAKYERDEIEKHLPADSITQYDLELETATSRLNRLTDLVPLEHRVENTKMSMEDARRNLLIKERELESADKTWRSALRSAGLPEALEPEQLKEIISRSDRISGFNSRLDQLRVEQELKQKEISTIQQRIESTLHETGLPFEEAGLSERLELISRAINEQRIHVSARKELATKYKLLRARLNKTKRELDRQLGIKQRLLAAVGAESEEAYRSIAAKHVLRRKLEKKRAELDDQIRLSIGKQFKHEELQEIFANFGAGGLDKRWEALQAEVELDREEQNRMMQLRGELMQEVKALGDDSRLDEVRLELNSIETEIGKLKLKWQELGASTQMLEMIRESYESKRQPETLMEASGYLEKLSDRKYTRIWTRMTGEELLVDNVNGESIAVDKLSRGTREAVFLSLRLALVGAYARRGALIPMVLDDVLVNFDGQRARNAAEVLYDFSRNGYQILMFTCHDHIRDIFHSLGADVRILPAHKDVFESQVKPTLYDGDGPRIQFPVRQREITVEPEAVPTAMPAAAPVTESAPIVDPLSIPVEYVAPVSNLDLQPESYDQALAYELSAIESDQREEQRLRHELVFISPMNQDREILLGGNDPIWWQNDAVMR